MATRILIVKLSSLGDVVHAMPVVHDISQSWPDAKIDWVVEPAFAPLVSRVAGVSDVIECAQRRWRKAWWTPEVRAEWRAFRARMRAHRYEAVIDLQGLTKSALVARMAHGRSFGLGNRTEGSSFERPARWLVDRPIELGPRIHAVDRSRELAAAALGYTVQGAPRYGLQARALSVSREALMRPTVAFIHGSSRDDKLWPEAAWIELGRRCISAGWRVALPQSSVMECERAERVAEALGRADAAVWPAMGLDAMVDQLGSVQGVVGVDSGLSHMAVALNLPHVQLYNFPTAWRTGPQLAHGHRHQVSLEADPVLQVDSVWQAWQTVSSAGASIA